MTLVLELPPDMEARLRELADQHGETLEEYVAFVVDERLNEDEQDHQTRNESVSTNAPMENPT